MHILNQNLSFVVPDSSDWKVRRNMQSQPSKNYPFKTKLSVRRTVIVLSQDCQYWNLFFSTNCPPKTSFSAIISAPLELVGRFPLRTCTGTWNARLHLPALHAAHAGAVCQLPPAPEEHLTSAPAARQGQVGHRKKIQHVFFSFFGKIFLSAFPQGVSPFKQLWVLVGCLLACLFQNNPLDSPFPEPDPVQPQAAWQHGGNRSGAVTWRHPSESHLPGAIPQS